MASPAFNTLSYARKLTKGGVAQAQADAHAQALLDVITESHDELVTTQHFNERIAKQESKLTWRFGGAIAGAVVIILGAIFGAIFGLLPT